MHYLAQLLMDLALGLPDLPLLLADDDQLLLLALDLLALLEHSQHSLELVLRLDGGGGLGLLLGLLVLGLHLVLEELADGLAQEGVGVGGVLGEKEKRLEISLLLEGEGFV